MNNVCLDVCFKIIIIFGSGIDVVVDCGGICGISFIIVISFSGLIVIILLLVVCFLIVLKDDLSVDFLLISFYF